MFLPGVCHCVAVTRVAVHVTSVNAAANHAGAAPLAAGELAALTNTREENAVARTAKLLAFPQTLAEERLTALLQPLARPGGTSPLTSMALLEVLSALAVGAFRFGLTIGVYRVQLCSSERAKLLEMPPAAVPYHLMPHTTECPIPLNVPYH